MKAKYKILITLLTAVSLSASQSLELKEGWNLSGSLQDGIESSIFTDANTLWKYSEGAWKAVSPNGTLTTAISNAGIGSFTKIDAGEGFWVNNSSIQTLQINGTEPDDINLSIVSGWQLISPKVLDDFNVSDKFNDTDNITTVWKYSNGSWLAYSPDTQIQQQIDSAGLSTLKSISGGEGFWVNAKNSASIGFEASSESNTTIEQQYNKMAVFERDDEYLKPLSNAKIYKNGSLIGTTDIFGSIKLESTGVYDILKDDYITETKVLTNTDLFDAVIMEKNETVLDSNSSESNIEAGENNISDFGNWNLIPQSTAVSAAPVPKLYTNIDSKYGIVLYEFSSTGDATLVISEISVPELSNVIGAFDMNFEDSLGFSITPEEVNFSGKFKPVMLNVDLNSSSNYLVYGYIDDQWTLISKADLVNTELKSKEKVTQITKYAFVEAERTIDRSICIEDSNGTSLDGALVLNSGVLYESQGGCFNITVTSSSDSAMVYSAGYLTKSIDMQSDQNITMESINMQDITATYSDFFGLSTTTLGGSKLCLDLLNDNNNSLGSEVCSLINNSSASFSLPSELINSDITIYDEQNSDSASLVSLKENISFASAAGLSKLHEGYGYVNYTDIIKYGTSYLIPNKPNSFGIYNSSLNKTGDLNLSEVVFDSYANITDDRFYLGSFAGNIYEYKNDTLSKIETFENIGFGIEGGAVYKAALMDNKIYIPTSKGNMIIYDVSSDFSYIPELYLSGSDSNVTLHAINTPVADQDNSIVYASNYEGKVWKIYNDSTSNDTKIDLNSTISANAMMVYDGYLYVSTDDYIYKINQNLAKISQLGLGDKGYFVKSISGKIVVAGENEFNIISPDLSTTLECSLKSGPAVSLIEFDSNLYLFEKNGTMYKITGSESSCSDISNFSINNTISAASTIDDILVVHLGDGSSLGGKK